MRVFVGYGYNERDKWIEDHVFPVLECMGFVVVHGKDMHGQILQPEVDFRIDQSDAVVGFFTEREGQGTADFTSHIWVRDEILHALLKNKPVVLIREDTAKVPEGMIGNRQYIILRQNDRLACVAELVRALGRKNIRRIRLEPQSDELRQDLFRLQRTPGFEIRYQTQDENGMESQYKQGRLEIFRQGFYLNAMDVPHNAYVAVEGVLGTEVKFISGWESADAVMVKIN
jgi:hypothetical protein